MGKRAKANSLPLLVCISLASSLVTAIIMGWRPWPAGALGLQRERGQKAFLLTVHLSFRSDPAAQQLLEAWAVAADYCAAAEPFLYTYEVAQSDKDPLRYTIFERYRTKNDYLTKHKSSEAFKHFRPAMQAMQDSGDVIVAGDSFYELGIGFT
ncbi:unnamed protein product [Chrysoparadoxa australica]